jgi:hypothetical protein
VAPTKGHYTRVRLAEHAFEENVMMNKSARRITTAAVAVAYATVADAAAQSAPVTGHWAPLLVTLGLVALVGILLLVTRPGVRRGPTEWVETEPSTLRSQDKQFAHELKILWDKPTTTETLLAREEAQASPLEEKR